MEVGTLKVKIILWIWGDALGMAVYNMLVHELLKHMVFYTSGPRIPTYEIAFLEAKDESTHCKAAIINV